MPALRKTEGRVLGPYEIKYSDGRPSAWRVITVAVGGVRKNRNYDTKDEAKVYVAQQKGNVAAQQRMSIDRAILAYNERQLKGAGQKPSSYETTVRRLRKFFEPCLKMPVEKLTHDRCLALYDGEFTKDGRCTRPGLRNADPKLGPVYSADYHRNILAESKTFARWLVDQGMVAADPLAKVKPVGIRNRGGIGQTDLTDTEIEMFDAVLVKLAKSADLRKRRWAAVGMMGLYLGLRAGEIASARVRQLSQTNHTFEVVRGKTKKSKRLLAVPALLMECLAPFVAGKGLEDTILPAFTRGRMKHGAPEVAMIGRVAAGQPMSRFAVRLAVREVCVLAKVRMESAHGLRGAFAKLAMEGGAETAAVQRALGHTRASMTEQYAGGAAVDQTRAERAQKRLGKGRK